MYSASASAECRLSAGLLGPFVDQPAAAAQAVGAAAQALVTPSLTLSLAPTLALTLALG